MADEKTKIDVNQTHTIAGVTYDASEDIMNLTLNPVDKRLRVDADITDVGDGATSAKQDDIISELQDIEAGIITNDPWNGYGFYAALDDDTTTYIMHQNTSGAWILQKIVDATGVVTYCKGSSDASTAWTNRETQTFADFDTVFS